MILTYLYDAHICKCIRMLLFICTHLELLKKNGMALNISDTLLTSIIAFSKYLHYQIKIHHYAGIT